MTDKVIDVEVAVNIARLKAEGVITAEEAAEMIEDESVDPGGLS